MEEEKHFCCWCGCRIEEDTEKCPVCGGAVFQGDIAPAGSVKRAKKGNTPSSECPDGESALLSLSMSDLFRMRAVRIGAIVAAVLLLIALVAAVRAFLGDMELQRLADEGRNARLTANYSSEPTDASGDFAVASATSGSVSAGSSSELFLSDGKALLYLSGCSPSNLSEGVAKEVVRGSFLSLNYHDGSVYALLAENDGAARSIVKIDVTGLMSAGNPGDSSANSDTTAGALSADNSMMTVYTAAEGKVLSDLYLKEGTAYWIEKNDSVCSVMSSGVGGELTATKVDERTAQKAWLTIEEGEVFLLWAAEDAWALESLKPEDSSFAALRNGSGKMTIGCYHAGSIYYALENNAMLTREGVAGDYKEYPSVKNPTSIAAYGGDVVATSYGNRVHLIALSSDIAAPLPDFFGEVGANVSSTSLVVGIWRGCPILQSSGGALLYCSSKHQMRSFEGFGSGENPSTLEDGSCLYTVK